VGPAPPSLPIMVRFPLTSQAPSPWHREIPSPGDPSQEGCRKGHVGYRQPHCPLLSSCIGVVIHLLPLSWGQQSSVATMGCWKSAFLDVCQTGVRGAKGELSGHSKIAQPMGAGRSVWVPPSHAA